MFSIVIFALVSDWYGFDDRTQFEFLIDVLSATPRDVRVA
jgi:hypothetical protein